MRNSLLNKFLLVSLSLFLLILTACNSSNNFNCEIGIIDTEITKYNQGTTGYDFLENNELKRYSFQDKTHGDYIYDIIQQESVNNEDIIYLTAISSEKVNTYQTIFEAIEYINSLNIRICNMSLSLNEHIEQLDQLIKESDTLFIVAAGNFGVNLDEDSICYPACFNYDNVITVASVNNNGKLMEDSNYGPNSVDIAYYGVLDEANNDCEGTSFACAKVTAIVYEMLQENPKLSNQDIKEILLNNCDQTLKGKIASNGILNKNQAIKAAKSWQS